MNDFTERASWYVAERFEDANHAPEVEVAEGLDLVAAAGETLTLHTVAIDPDGDELVYEWFRYGDADTCPDEVTLDACGASCVVHMPACSRPLFTLRPSFTLEVLP